MMRKKKKKQSIQAVNVLRSVTMFVKHAARLRKMFHGKAGSNTGS